MSATSLKKGYREVAEYAEEHPEACTVRFDKIDIGIVSSWAIFFYDCNEDILAMYELSPHYPFRLGVMDIAHIRDIVAVQ